MPSVVSRVARYHYGVRWGRRPQDATPKVDLQKDEFYTDPDGNRRVLRMDWYLKQVSSNIVGRTAT